MQFTISDWNDMTRSMHSSTVLPETRQLPIFAVRIDIEIQKNSIDLEVCGFPQGDDRAEHVRLLGNTGQDTLEDIAQLYDAKMNRFIIELETITQAVRAADRLAARLEAFAEAIRIANEAEFEASIAGLENQG